MLVYCNEVINLKHKKLISFILIIFAFLLMFNYKISKTKNTTNNIEFYLEKFYINDAHNFRILIKKEIDNKTVVVFNYLGKKYNNIYYGYAIFNNVKYDKYKCEDCSSSGESLQIFKLKFEETQKEYIVFAGKISNDSPNKFEIYSDSKNFIEIFNKNELFIKYYPLEYDEEFRIITVY